MRFQLTATKKTEVHTLLPAQEIEVLAVIFTVPTWDDAAEWAKNFLDQIGDREQFTTLITYASNTEGYFRNEKRELTDGFENGPLPRFSAYPIQSEPTDREQARKASEAGWATPFVKGS